MNFSLTEEQKLIQKTAKDFATNELAPGAINRDADKIWPSEQVKKMSKLGLMGIMVAPKWNGGGMDAVSYALAMEAVSYTHLTLPTILVV